MNPCRFFVAGLLPECEEEDLVRHFSTYGSVAQAMVAREPDTMVSRCCGLVWMGDSKAVEQVLQKEHHIWEHRILVKPQAGEEDEAVDLNEIIGPPAGSSCSSDHKEDVQDHKEDVQDMNAHRIPFRPNDS